MLVSNELDAEAEHHESEQHYTNINAGNTHLLSSLQLFT
jgi:hypothetical protein